MKDERDVFVDCSHHPLCEMFVLRLFVPHIAILRRCRTVTANSDIPRPMRVHMSKTFPSWYSVGVNDYNRQIDDICSSGSLSPPENDDAGYSCPSAGTYNFHFSFKNPGSRRNFFAGWSGYSYGVNVHFRHETEGGDWATCHMNVKVKKTEMDSYLTNAKFLSVAGLGIASLAMGLFLRRRKERVAGEDDKTDECGERETNDMATNFELVQDHAVV